MILTAVDYWAFDDLSRALANTNLVCILPSLQLSNRFSHSYGRNWYICSIHSACFCEASFRGNRLLGHKTTRATYFRSADNQQNRHYKMVFSSAFHRISLGQRAISRLHAIFGHPWSGSSHRREWAVLQNFRVSRYSWSNFNGNYHALFNLIFQAHVTAPKMQQDHPKLSSERAGGRLSQAGRLEAWPSSGVIWSRVWTAANAKGRLSGCWALFKPKSLVIQPGGLLGNIPDPIKGRGKPLWSIHLPY